MSSSRRFVPNSPEKVTLVAPQTAGMACRRPRASENQGSAPRHGEADELSAALANF